MTRLSAETFSRRNSLFSRRAAAPLGGGLTGAQGAAAVYARARHAPEHRLSDARAVRAHHDGAGRRPTRPGNRAHHDLEPVRVAAPLLPAPQRRQAARRHQGPAVRLRPRQHPARLCQAVPTRAVQGRLQAMLACSPTQRMQEIIEQVYDRLFNFCVAFVDSMRRALYAMPYLVRCDARAIGSLHSCTTGGSASLSPAACVTAASRPHPSGSHCMQACSCSRHCSAALGDVVFSRFIGPAINDPDRFGIISDPMSATARCAAWMRRALVTASRRNLSLVARVLRDVTQETPEAELEPYMVPLLARCVLCCCHLAVLTAGAPHGNK